MAQVKERFGIPNRLGGPPLAPASLPACLPRSPRPASSACLCLLCLLCLPPCLAPCLPALAARPCLPGLRLARRRRQRLPRTRRATRTRSPPLALHSRRCSLRWDVREVLGPPGTTNVHGAFSRRLAKLTRSDHRRPTRAPREARKGAAAGHVSVAARGGRPDPPRRRADPAAGRSDPTTRAPSRAHGPYAALFTLHYD